MDLTEWVIRLVALLVFVSCNSILFHYIAKWFNLEEGMMPPTLVSFCLGAVMFVASLLGIASLPFFIVALAIPLAVTKELYKTTWLNAAKVNGVWILFYIAILVIIAIIS